MNEIAVYGAGGLGKEIVCVINIINSYNPTWSFIGFFDDSIPKGTQINDFGEVIGNRGDLIKWNRSLNVVIAIASPKIIRMLHENITNPHISYPNIIHPDFNQYDKQTFDIGKGNIITSGCVSTCNVSIGNFNILNGRVVIGHDVKIGSYNTIMPNVQISGEVTIGDMNFFGISSIILQQITIGNRTRIGVGSVVMKNTIDEKLYIGNPAKIFNY